MVGSLGAVVTAGVDVGVDVGAVGLDVGAVLVDGGLMFKM